MITATASPIQLNTLMPVVDGAVTPNSTTVAGATPAEGFSSALTTQMNILAQPTANVATLTATTSSMLAAITTAATTSDTAAATTVMDTATTNPVITGTAQTSQQTAVMTTNPQLVATQPVNTSATSTNNGVVTPSVLATQINTASSESAMSSEDTAILSNVTDTLKFITTGSKLVDTLPAGKSVQLQAVNSTTQLTQQSVQSAVQQAVTNTQVNTPAAVLVQQITPVQTAEMSSVQPSEVANGGVQTQPVVTQQVATPVVTQQVATPVVTQQVATPVVTQQVATPVVTQQVATPVVTQQVATPVVTQQVATPVVTQQVATPVVTQQVATPVVTQQVATPVVTQQVATPVVTQQAATPVVTQQAATPVVTQQAATPVVTQQAATPEKPIVTAQVSTPVVAQQAATPEKPIVTAQVSTPAVAQQTATAEKPIVTVQVSTPAVAQQTATAEKPIVTAQVSTPAVAQQAATVEKPVLAAEVSIPVVAQQAEKPVILAEKSGTQVVKEQTSEKQPESATVSVKMEKNANPIPVVRTEVTTEAEVQPALVVATNTKSIFKETDPEKLNDNMVLNASEGEAKKDEPKDTPVVEVITPEMAAPIVVAQAIPVHAEAEKAVFNSEATKNEAVTSEKPTLTPAKNLLMDAIANRSNANGDMGNNSGNNTSSNPTLQGEALLSHQMADSKLGNAETKTFASVFAAEKSEPLSATVTAPTADKSTPQASATAAVNKLAQDTKMDVPAMTRPLTHPDWNQEMGERIVWMNNRGISSAEIKMNPQNMGPITVRIDMNQDQATIAFTAQNSDVRTALEASIPKLREMLSSQQVTLADVNVSQQSSGSSTNADSGRSQQQTAQQQAQMMADASASNGQDNRQNNPEFDTDGNAIRVSSNTDEIGVDEFANGQIIETNGSNGLLSIYA